MEDRLVEEDLGEAGLDGVGEAGVAEGELHQLLIELDLQLTDDNWRTIVGFNLIPFPGRYSGGRKSGGSLPKAAVAAWGGYQV